MVDVRVSLDTVLGRLEIGPMEALFGYQFPAIRGIQAGREYYVSMCPMRLLPKIFLFDEAELVPELRAQRRLNKGRLPEMARYVTNNPSNYTFSAITASIDGEVKFSPLSDREGADRIGLLQVSMESRFVINDGQHRRAAIEMALHENPSLGDETIAVVFFLDVGLDRCQQMFADLNRHVVRPSPSIGVLYDHRDETAEVARCVALKCKVFQGVVEMESSTLSARSKRLFTLSAIHNATKALLDGLDLSTVDQAASCAQEFWTELGRHMPEWGLVAENKLSGAEVRKDFIHSHGVVLQALGRVGNTLLRSDGSWKRKLANLKRINWSRSTGLWEGRAMIGGRVQKTGQNITLTVNVIKKQLGIPLSAEEERVEASYKRGDHAR